MYIFLLLSFLFINDGFLFKHHTKLTSKIKMNLYDKAKEYHDFYNKYKQPILTTHSNLINYEEFAKFHNNSYSIFRKNWNLIHNANYDLQQQNKNLVLGENEFMDIIDFDHDYNCKNSMLHNVTQPLHNANNYKKMINKPVQYLQTIFKDSSRFSWNDTGLLSPVKNQLSCGSCWAFSTTSSLETFMRKKNFTIDRLSEQELVDCSEKNQGCNGGLMNLAYDYIIERKGLTSDKNYPYKASHNKYCLRNITREIGSNITEYAYIIPESILDMKYSVMQNPVSIALDADNIFFRFYKQGVIDLPINISTTINHAVLLVGFDHDEEGMYWIIQNSWGEQWGDNGFCKIRVQPNEGTLLCQIYGVYPTK